MELGVTAVSARSITMRSGGVCSFGERCAEEVLVRDGNNMGVSELN
jgi:hypothetical protein